MKFCPTFACLLSIAASGVAWAQPVQWRVTDGGNGHWYEVVRGARLQWSAASDYAVARGAHLATINSLQENAFVWSAVHTQLLSTWLGGSLSATGFKWVTGEPFDCNAMPYTGLPSGGRCPFGPEDSLYTIDDGTGTYLAIDDHFSSFQGGKYTYLLEWESDCNGDGIVDYGQILSGQLADSNLDGTPDICQTPASNVSWIQRPVSGPSARFTHAMATDGARGTTLLFGGLSVAGNLGDTWTWNGSSWTQLAVAGPAPRSGHAMTYDESRGVVVLFGGYNGSSYFGDTWEWSGSAWALRTTSGPSPRVYHAMAYDEARHVTVLFGGSGAAGNNGETWEWNGSSWTQRSSVGPSPRDSHAMTYDSRRHVTVLFGGNGPGGNNGETWEWNGVQWTQRATNGPSARFQHALCYDAGRDVCVLVGGYQYSNNSASGETWEWNGTFWNARTGAGPSPRYGFAANHSRSTGNSLIFGGYSNGTYNGESWELVPPCIAPAITSQPANLHLAVGANASLTLDASGSSPSYRWRRNGTALSDSSRITGASTNTLNILSMQASDQGTYDCLVTNACGTATSVGAELSCTPIITSQPPAGARLTAGLSVAVGVPTNAAYTYRWRQNGQNLFNIPGLISGATLRTLTLLSDDASLVGSYDCVLTSACGTTVSSAVEIPCPADFNFDGGVDGEDLFAFFSAWEQGLTEADLSQDGGVDIGDVTFFFEKWEAGC